MSWGMAASRETGDRAVAEDVVLAVQQQQLVANVEIAAIEAVRHGNVRIQSGLPFAPLHEHRRIGNEGVAADMVEMKMRVDQDANPCRVAADRAEARTDLLT